MPNYSLSKRTQPGMVLGAIASQIKDWFTVHNPQTIKATVLEANQRRLAHIDDAALWRHRAMRFWFLADWFWASNRITGGMKSGWYYVLAGWCFEKAGAYREAGDLYHYAGHQFRRWQSLEKAMAYYFASAAVLLRHLGEDETARKSAHRSARRAIGLSKESGDEELLKQWMEGISGFQQYIDQFSTQNPWD